MPEPMTTEQALGWMAVSVLNDHFPHPQDDAERDNPGDPMGGCCVINCGPCGALHWISQDPARRNAFEAQIMLTGFHIGGWSHWDDDTAGLNWDWFEAYWARHTTCGMSDGVPTGCTFDDPDGPEGLLDFKRSRWILTCDRCGAVGSYPESAHDIAVRAWIGHAKTVHGIDDKDSRALLLGDRAVLGTSADTGQGAA